MDSVSEDGKFTKTSPSTDAAPQELDNNERFQICVIYDSWRKLVHPDVLVKGLQSARLLTGKDETVISLKGKGSSLSDFLYHRLFIGATYKDVCGIRSLLQASGNKDHVALAKKLPDRDLEKRREDSEDEQGRQASSCALSTGDSGIDDTTPTSSLNDSVPIYSDEDEDDNDKTLGADDITVMDNDMIMTQPFGLQAQGSDSSEEDEEMLSPDKLNYLFSTANHELQKDNMSSEGLQSVDIDKEYQFFCENRLERDYIQGCYKNQKTKKIYIDIEKTHLKEATIYFQKYFRLFWQRNLLELVEQEPIVYYIEEPSDNPGPKRKRKRSADHDQVLSNTKKTCTSGNAGKGQPKRKTKIQTGGNILAIPKHLKSLLNGKTNLQEVMEAIKHKTGSDPLQGTIAGFVQDKSGNIYMLTVRHVLKGYWETKPGREPIVNLNPGHEVEPLPVYTEIYPENQPSQIIEIGSEYFGYCGVLPSSKHGIDQALVKLHKNIIQHQQAKLQPMNHQNQQVELQVFEKDDQMYNQDVEKEGTTTGITKGTILPITRDHKFYGMDKACSGTFMIKSQFTNMEFAQPGDSGALITSVMDDKVSGTAYGMVLAGTPEYKHTDETGTQITYKNITFGLRLDNALRFAESEWGMRGLRFLDKSSGTGTVQSPTQKMNNELPAQLKT